MRVIALALPRLYIFISLHIATTRHLPCTTHCRIPPHLCHTTATAPAFHTRLHYSGSVSWMRLDRTVYHTTLPTCLPPHCTRACWRSCRIPAACVPLRTLHHHCTGGASRTTARTHHCAAPHCTPPFLPLPHHHAAAPHGSHTPARLHRHLTHYCACHYRPAHRISCLARIFSAPRAACLRGAAYCRAAAACLLFFLRAPPCLAHHAPPSCCGRSVRRLSLATLERRSDNIAVLPHCTAVPFTFPRITHAHRRSVTLFFLRSHRSRLSPRAIASHNAPAALAWLLPMLTYLLPMPALPAPLFLLSPHADRLPRLTLLPRAAIHCFLRSIRAHGQRHNAATLCLAALLPASRIARVSLRHLYSTASALVTCSAAYHYLRACCLPAERRRLITRDIAAPLLLITPRSRRRNVHLCASPPDCIPHLRGAVTSALCALFFSRSRISYNAAHLACTSHNAHTAASLSRNSCVTPSACCCLYHCLGFIAHAAALGTASLPLRACLPRRACCRMFRCSYALLSAFLICRACGSRLAAAAICAPAAACRAIYAHILPACLYIAWRFRIYVARLLPYACIAACCRPRRDSPRSAARGCARITYCLFSLPLPPT